MDTHKQAQKIVDAYLKEINLQVGDKIWTENLVDVCARGIEQARAAALEEAAMIAQSHVMRYNGIQISAAIRALKG